MRKLALASMCFILGAYSGLKSAEENREEKREKLWELTDAYNNTFERYIHNLPLTCVSSAMLELEKEKEAIELHLAEMDFIILNNISNVFANEDKWNNSRSFAHIIYAHESDHRSEVPYFKKKSQVISGTQHLFATQLKKQKINLERVALSYKSEPNAYLYSTHMPHTFITFYTNGTVSVSQETRPGTIEIPLYFEDLPRKIQKAYAKLAVEHFLSREIVSLLSIDLCNDDKILETKNAESLRNQYYLFVHDKIQQLLALQSYKNACAMKRVNFAVERMTDKSFNQDQAIALAKIELYWKKRNWLMNHGANLFKQLPHFNEDQKSEKLSQAIREILAHRTKEEQIALIEEKLNTIVKVVEEKKKRAFLALKKAFLINSGVWQQMVCLCEDITSLSKNYYNQPLRGTIDSNLPSGIRSLLLEELGKAGINLSRFTISLSDGFNVIAPEAVGELRYDKDTGFTTQLTGFEEGTISIPANHSKTFIKLAVTFLTKYEDIFYLQKIIPLINMTSQRLETSREWRKYLSLRQVDAIISMAARTSLEDATILSDLVATQKHRFSREDYDFMLEVMALKHNI